MLQSISMAVGLSSENPFVVHVGCGYSLRAAEAKHLLNGDVLALARPNDGLYFVVHPQLGTLNFDASFGEGGSVLPNPGDVLASGEVKGFSEGGYWTIESAGEEFPAQVFYGEFQGRSLRYELLRERGTDWPITVVLRIV